MKRSAVVRFIYLLLFISPLPFASARPVWQYFWVVFIGLSGLIYAIRWKSLNDAKLPKVFYFPVGATLFLVFWGVLQVQFGWSVTSQHTITTTLYFFSHLIWFFLIFKSFKRQSDIPKFILMIAMIITAYCVYGLVIYFTGNEHILWYEKQAYTDSLTSTFINRNSFSTYVGIGLQCIISYGLWSHSHRAPNDHPFRVIAIHFLSRDLNIITLSSLVMFSALLLTGSRAGIATTFTGILFLYIASILTRPENSTNRSQIPAVIMTMAISIIFIVFFELSGELLRKRADIIIGNDSRFIIYPLTIEAIKEAPLLGHGLGTFFETFSQYRTINLHQTIMRLHNDILELILTSGIIVSLIFIFSLLFASFSLFRFSQRTSEYRIPLLLIISVFIQISIHSLFDFSLQMPAVVYLFTALFSAGAFLIIKGHE